MMSSSPNGLLHLVKTNQNMNLVDYMKQRKFEVKVRCFIVSDRSWIGDTKLRLYIDFSCLEYVGGKLPKSIWITFLIHHVSRIY